MNKCIIKKMNVSIFFFFVLLLIFSSKAYAEDNHTDYQIKGIVINTEYAGEPGCIIDIYNNDKWMGHTYGDEKGIFEIKGLLDGNYKIHATPNNASKYATTEEFIVEIKDGKYTGREVILKLREPNLKGIVVTPDGGPLGDWTCVLKITKPYIDWQKSDVVYGNGEFRFADLPDGIYLISALPVVEGYRYSESPTFKIEIKNGKYTGHEIRLILEDRNKPHKPTVYYVDYTSGNDSNSGTSQSTPWKTINRVNSSFYYPGDKVLFKRGEVWRDRLIISSSGTEKDPIVFGAYGTGADPIILGSSSYSNKNDWENIGNNLWATAKDSFPIDVGFILLGSEQTNNVGYKCDYLNNPGLLRGVVNKPGQYYHDPVNKRVILYSDINPAEKYKSIEIGTSVYQTLNENIIEAVHQSCFKIENISIKYFNCHGIDVAFSHHVTISNCTIAYGGGQYQYENQKIRFGNGIGFGGDAHDNTVEGCSVFEMYDAGVTNQGDTYVFTQYNIYYRNNLIWNCVYSFELFERLEGSVLRDIYFENNICLNAGRNWSYLQRQNPSQNHQSANIKMWETSAETENIFIQNNILYEAVDSCLYMNYGWLNPSAVKLDKNIYYQRSGYMVDYKNSKYTMSQFSKYKKEKNNDINSTAGDLSVIKNSLLNALKKRNIYVANSLLKTVSMWSMEELQNVKKTLNLK